MQHKFLIIILVLFFAGAYVAWDLVRLPSANVLTQEKEVSPNLQLAPNPVFSSLEGVEYSLHDFKGKVILLNFWASWCAPCVVEFPELLKLASLKKDNLALLAISVDEDKSNITTFFKKHKFQIKSDNVIIAHDPDKTISQDMFQTTLYPETFIIGPDLNIQKKIAGLTDWTGDEILSFIGKLINDAPDNDHNHELGPADQPQTQ